MERAKSDKTIRVVLICHHDAPMHFDGIARWLASWSQLAGIVVIREQPAVLRRRIRREWRRVGTRGLLDVLAFRLFYAMRLRTRDSKWLSERLDQLRSTYAPVATETPRIEVPSPNVQESLEFVRQCRPDIIVALCKNILAERIFSIARFGTVVFHPGICPEYRNAHGCFWALANDDRERVGLTVLKIDKGIDSGPVLGYMHAAFDEVNDSHVVIQHKVLLDNLDAIRTLLVEFVSGRVPPIDVSGRASREWGQPWLTAWHRWKTRARRRHAAHRA